jgi:hypothetical protein
MPNFNLKGIPTKLFQRLKKSAKGNRRSLTSEIIYRLEESISVRAIAKPAAAKKKEP